MSSAIPVLSMPYWPSGEQVLAAAFGQADGIAHAWRLVSWLWSLAPQVAVFVPMVLLILACHELGHCAMAGMIGLKVRRIVVGSPKGKLLLRLRLGDQIIEVFRRLPVFTSLDVGEDAWPEDGFWQRCALALGGPLTNLGLVLLTGWIVAGLDGTVLGLRFLASSFRAIALLPSLPFGGGSPGGSFGGPIQEVLGLAQAQGFGWVGSCWMLLNALMGTANLIPFPTLDGGLLVLAVLMRFGRRGEAVTSRLGLWYERTRQAAWLPLIVVTFLFLPVVASLT
jgi:membrane-associated protease RseP (regulator of RpoE activity)